MNDTLPTNDNPGTPPAESKDEFDYDSLLNEYEQGKTAPPPTPAPDPAVRQLIKEFKPIAEVAQAHLNSEAKTQEQELVKQAISTVKEDESASNVPDGLVEAHLNLQYIRNPEFKTAFETRDKNPTAWNAALVNARESLMADLGQISKISDRDDTAAALAAVRGTSQTEIDDADKVDPKELFKMSDQDFAEYKRNLGS